MIRHEKNADTIITVFIIVSWHRSMAQLLDGCVVNLDVVGSNLTRICVYEMFILAVDSTKVEAKRVQKTGNRS